MNVRILELIEGAKQARGLTVIIDVYRAFSLESYLFGQGAKAIFPIGSIEEALAYRKEHPDYITFGERHGAQVEGFEYGNSPSQVAGKDLTGKCCIHTTSAGTQGIVNATGATEIVAASLVNAGAIARYIQRKDPEEVSIVAMGNQGVSTADEDVLCAHYIKALLEGADYEQTRALVQQKAEDLRTSAGKKFFDPKQPAFPEGDFELCSAVDRFAFAIRVGHDETGRLVNTRFDC